jgi:hypothetical protein
MWAIISALGSVPQILGLVTTTVQGITQAISNEKIALINATTDREKIEISERISSLTAQRDVLIADSNKSSVDMWMRVIAASGPVSYITKVFLWDKVIGSFAGCSGHTVPGTCELFTTDPVTADQWYVVLIVLGFYFVHSTVGLFKGR